ncbi:MAG TPA: alpha/beta hydrolase [Patescibacteria group bacterium]|nr:alpha/beta hydrolase [Patescibacteria group bacterium]
MIKTDKREPADFIRPLIINGLRGRVLTIPPIKKTAKREILLVYGSHASLERMFGVTENMAEYGTVTMPDLPGFGGMDSFYKLKEKPSLDNLADYLATFIKLTYKKRQITIGAMSLGFLIVTKMLQKYPELSKQVDILISIVGFTNKDDFRFKRKTYLLFRWGSSMCSNYVMSTIAKYLVLRGPIIRATYNFVADKHVKMKDANEVERNKRIDFEINLWKCNDIRTYMDTTITMMTVDLTNKIINLPLLHISVDADQYFYKQKVEDHLKKIFISVVVYKAKMTNHAPTVIGDAESAKDLIPKEIRKILARIPS